MRDGNGDNAFVDDSDPDGLSDLARRCIAGLVRDHVAMAAVVAPTVNAYKRLQPGSLAGCYANWGLDHRGVAVRVPPARGEGTRLEHRLADGAASVHVAAAAALVAALRGVADGLDCPPAETQDCISGADTDVRVPESLGAALDALEASEEFVARFSPDYVDGLLTVKRAEWSRYLAHTTDWELDEYLEYF
jgi:glutamine synthetase